MRERVNELLGRLDARNLRERVLVLVTSVVLLVAVADLLVFKGLRTAMQRVDEQKTQARENMADSRAQIEALRDKLASDPNADVKERIEALEDRLSAVDSRLVSQQSELIGPAETVTVLRELVQQDDALELVSLRSEPVEVVEEFAVKDAGNGDDVPARVYSHGVQLVMEGSFGDALRYLRAVENLSWRFFWDRLDIEVVEYPKTEIRLRLHTLSLDEDWIGV